MARDHLVSDEEYFVPRFQRALAVGGGTHDFVRDVVPMLLDGRAQWWREGNGAVITEILNYPNFKVLNHWLIAGELEGVLAVRPQIERWARMQGCARAIGIGRPGWMRVMQRYGYRPWGTALVKELTQ